MRTGGTPVWLVGNQKKEWDRPDRPSILMFLVAKNDMTTWPTVTNTDQDGGSRVSPSRGQWGGAILKDHWISKIMSWLWIGEPWYNWYTLGSLYLFGIWDLQRAIPLQLTAIPKGRLYNHLQSTDLWKHGSNMKHSKSEEIPNHPMFADQTSQCFVDWSTHFWF